MKNSLLIIFCLCCFSLTAQKKAKQVNVQIPKTWTEAVLAVKANQTDSCRAKADKLLGQFRSEVVLFLSFSNSRILNWVCNPTDSIERATTYSVVNQLKDGGLFSSQLKKLDVEPDLSKRVSGWLSVFENAVKVYQLQEQLVWMNVRAVETAFNDVKNTKGYDLAANQEKLNELKNLTNKGFDAIYQNNQVSIAAAKRALQLKKEILFSNPKLDFDRLLISRYRMGTYARIAMAPALGTQNNNWSNQGSSSRKGFDAEIDEFTNLRGDIKSRTVFKPENGSSVPDLKLHWNANKVMFSMVDVKKMWQVYEVGIDGKSLNQVTRSAESDLEFFDACYLPSGKVMAVSNVGYQAVPCVDGSDAVGNMVLYDPKDGNLRRLTFDQDANWHPTMMHNGRVMYVRWEYTDLTHYFSRIVMHMNPDGTEQRSLYGSGSVFPNSTFDIQPLPNNTSQFVGVISGHHGVARSGRLMLFDPAKSRKEEKGMIQEIPFRNRPIIPLVKDELVNDVWPQFLKPYPISDKYFFVTAKLSPNSLWGIYLVDVFDNMTLLAEYEGEGLIYSIPLIAQKTPPVIPEKINLNTKESTVFIQDIYEGEGLPGVPRGTVKELRVLAYEYAYNQSPSNHMAQGIQSGWDIKRLLGTVPVEKDGSVIFKIPANTPISLQPLDSLGRAIQWMRSWLTGMPGETVSCVGCHEDQNQIPMPKRVIASAKPPHNITAPTGGVRSFTYELEVQPILSRACVACHDGSGKLNYTAGRIDTFSTFSKSYLNLHPYVFRQGPEAGMKVLYPYEYHVSNSPLIRMLKNGHHGVKLTEKEWKTLYNWVDFNAPYHGSMQAEELSCCSNQIARRFELTNKYANGAGVDWQGEIKAYADYLKKQPPVQAVKPVESRVEVKDVKVKGFPFDATTAKAMLGKEKITRKTVELAQGVNVDFVRIPAGQFVMGNDHRPSDYSPASKAEVKKAFWMAELELTNEQTKVLLPNHDSKFYDQQWKDHVNEGYPANKPEQSAIRLSYNDAMELCKELSAKTGLNVTIPTEVQWEWACRAGSDADFWYGNMNADFSKFENLADAQTLKYAVSGVDPQPMNKKSQWYPYHIFLPKVDNVDDGHMLTAVGKQYQANPWGLYNMQGNVAEWTRSDYFPYPYNEKMQGSGQEKVLRGGSWYDHPKRSTAYYRRAYLPWQKVFNAGIRLVIED